MKKTIITLLFLSIFQLGFTQKKELKNGLTIKKLKKQAVPVVIQNFIEIFFQFDS